MGTFDPYLILTHFVSKISQALTPLSFDSPLTFIVDKQPLWLLTFFGSWRKTLTACCKVCMEFFRRKLIFMELTGMGQFHVIRMDKMLSLLIVSNAIFNQFQDRLICDRPSSSFGADIYNGTCSFYHRKCHGMKYYRPFTSLPRILATIRPTLRAQ